MQNALYVGLSRQIALHREMDVIANNLANMDTNGFKADGVTFEEYLATKARVDRAAPADQRVAFVRESGSITDFSQGTLQQTGGALDLAIRGDGYFVVETPQGERYTRNGSFSLNEKGELVNQQGYRVRGQNGPLQFDQQDNSITFGREGTITAINGNEKQVIERGKIRLVRFDNQNSLVREGNGLYRAGGQAPQNVKETTSIVQGSLEKSNVNPIIEMSRMLEVMRAYQSLAGMMNKTDDLRKSAIDKLASTPTA
jgi:flagellar basal-body rod protein FlgF/flagellar basal-body rod protein FlgG